MGEPVEPVDSNISEMTTPRSSWCADGFTDVWPRRQSSLVGPFLKVSSEGGAAP